MTTHYSSSTQPRRTSGRTHPPLPPLSTLPRSFSSSLDNHGPPSPKSHTMAPRGRRPHYSTSTAPAYRISQNGELTLTKRILSTAGQTGSTQDLRVLLSDALALTEKLDSVTASVGSRPTSSTSTRLSASSVFLNSPVAKSPRSPVVKSPRSPVVRSPGAYSETRSMFRARSLGNGLDDVGITSPEHHYETSATFSPARAASTTPVRKSQLVQNGHTSPPLASGTLPHLRRGSPLLNDARNSDYDTPKAAHTSRQLSQKSLMSQKSVTSISSQMSTGSAAPHKSTIYSNGHHNEGAKEPAGKVKKSDSVDIGLDCIAQLEALEMELRSYEPAQGPPSSQEGRGEVGSSNVEIESHYEVDPHYIPTPKKERSVPPSERVGGVRPTMKDFVDELTEVEQKVSEDLSDPHRPRGMTSSTATRELDELMANLSNFEPASSSSGGDVERMEGGGAVARESGKTRSTAMDNLNSMLGSLDEVMTKRHGVNTTAKGVCAACNKPILTKVVNALGCQWHKEHFTCAQCDVELGSSTYYESNGRPYCEKDYHELFAPRCAYCNGPILERVLRALDKTWHKEHFFCTLCGKDFGAEGYHEKDGKAFCRECYYEKFAPRCKRCEKAIMEGFVTALGSQWHPECFCCKVCGVTFPRGNYFDHEGEPHCEIHYHASRGTLCASCQKPVTGKCITAMGRKWHPEHFTCAFCLKLLNKGTFKEHRHNPYCQPCFIKLFG